MARKLSFLLFASALASCSFEGYAITTVDSSIFDAVPEIQDHDMRQRLEGFKLMAPISCKEFPSCGHDTSLATVRRSFQMLTKERANCNQLPTISINGVIGTLSIPVPDVYGNCAPLTTALVDDICDSPSDDYYFWAPAEQFSNRKASLEFLSLQSRSTTGTGLGRVFVQASDSPANEQHIAVCKVTEAGNAIGPPLNCVTVAIVLDREIWFRGARHSGVMCESAATLRLTGAIDIQFMVLTHLDPLIFSNSLLAMLKDLGLSPERSVQKSSSGPITSIYLKSAAGLRTSRILSNSRESVDYDVQLEVRADGLFVRGFAHVMVCDLALGSLTDYKGMNDGQRSEYTKALDDLTGAALRRACKSSVQQDSRTISCN